MIICRIYWKHRESKKVKIIMQEFKDEKAIERYIRSTMRWTGYMVMMLILEDYYDSED